MVAQASLWKSVKMDGSQVPRREPANPSDSQRRSMAGPLKASAKDWCPDEPPEDWLTKLYFEVIPVTAGREVWLVEGCEQGAPNGPMWLIRFDGGKPVLLASPDQDFVGGWVYSIQARVSHGYKDIVLGWTMGASEAILRYFRFDGQTYRQIATATRTDRIVPDALPTKLP
jgi:hypothetical protein